MTLDLFSPPGHGVPVVVVDRVPERIAERKNSHAPQRAGLYKFAKESGGDSRSPNSRAGLSELAKSGGRVP